MADGAGSSSHRSFGITENWLATQTRPCSLVILSIEHIVCYISKSFSRALFEIKELENISLPAVSFTLHTCTILGGIWQIWVTSGPGLGLQSPSYTGQPAPRLGDKLHYLVSISALSLRGRRSNLALISDHQEFDFLQSPSIYIY